MDSAAPLQEVNLAKIPWPEVFTLSHSSEETHASCARKTEFNKFWFNGKARTRSVSGDVGTALHNGIQHYLITGDQEASIWEMMRSYPIGLAEGGRYPERYRTLEACYATMEAVFSYTQLKEYQLSEIKCLDGEVRPAVEVPFLIKFKDFLLCDTVPVVYRGFIDLIMYEVFEREHVVIDIKSHRQDKLKDRTPFYQFSEQPIPYAIVLQKMLERELDHFTVKYLDVYVDIEKPHVQFYDFRKETTLVQDWLKGQALLLKQLELYMHLDWFPRTAKNCMSWNRKCQFFDLCELRSPGDIAAWIGLNNNEVQQEAFEFTPWVEFELELGI